MAPLMNVQIASATFKANPYPFYAQLRTETPVCRVMLPDKRMAYLITRYDDVVQTLKDQRFAKDRHNAMDPEQLKKEPWLPPMFKPLLRQMLDLDDPDHSRLRGLVHKAFTPRRIEQLQTRIQNMCDSLLDAAERRGNPDLIRDFAMPLPVAIIAELIGVPKQDGAKFQSWSNTLIASSASSWGIALTIPSMMSFMHYVRSLIKARRAEPRDDLTTALVQAEEAGEHLTEDELLAMIVLLLIAGHETTVNLIGNGTLSLLEHPEQLERLRGNPAGIKLAVEELLRYNSPVEMATERYASEDLIIAGETLPRGSLAFAVIASANRDERQFSNPDTLDLGREPNRHLAFGQGIHYCLGAPLARMEGQIAIATLLRRYPNLRLATPPAALRWRKGLVLRGLEALPIELVPARRTVHALGV